MSAVWWGITILLLFGWTCLLARREIQLYREWERKNPLFAPETPEPPASDDPYDIGAHAGRTGVEFWRNPHAPKSGSKNAYCRWSAGWCYGKQEADQ